MRSLLIFATCVVASLCALAVATPAHAQCATGCSSSASCNGTGKSGCSIACDGHLCNCTDHTCGTQLLPVVLDQGAQPRIRLASDHAEISGPATAALLVDCRGNVLDVRITGREGPVRLEDLPSIVLVSPREPPHSRMAVRE